MSKKEKSIRESLSGTKITRRTFLKGTAAFGSAAALAGCSSEDGGDTYYTSAPANTKVEETIKPAVCRPNCFSSCYLNAHVREGKIVKMSRRALPNRDYDRICLRGLSQVQRVYSSDRLLYPLKRKDSSPRGNPEWERISWPEAIKYITDKFKAIIADSSLGAKSIAHITASANYAAIQKAGMSKFMSIMDVTNIGPQIDMCEAVGMSRALGIGTVYPFMQANEPADFRNAKTIVAWGSNAAEAQIQSWHFIADAITENDAKLISVDVMLSGTASRATNFIHIRPGTDTLLALSMINEIIVNHSNPATPANCWVDYDFMQKNTIAPFLIDTVSASATYKKYLRYGALNATQKLAIQANTGRADANITADSLIAYQGGKFVATKYDTDLNNKPMLTAATTCEFGVVPAFDGITYKTAFQMLKERVAQYPAATTASQTGVQEAVVKEFARIYCTNGPASIITGFAPDHYNNGHHLYHAVTTLAAITGQMGKPGASIGIWIQFATSNAGALSARPADLPLATAVTIPYPLMATVFNVEGASAPTAQGNGGPSELFVGSPLKIRAMWTSWGNPLNTFVDPGSMIKMLTTKDGSDYRIKLSVVADTMVTDTAQYCDIVLPLAHWFEQDDVIANSNHPHMMDQPKVVDAPGECKTDYEIAVMLADAMGYGKYFKSTYEERASALVDGDFYRTYYKSTTGKDLLPEHAFSWERLRAEGALRNFPGTPDKPYIYPAFRKAYNATAPAQFSYPGCDSMVFGTNLGFPLDGGTKRIEFYAENIMTCAYYGQVSIPIPGLGGAFLDNDMNLDNERLPGWEAPDESKPGNSAYPLQLISERQRWRVHSQWSHTPWIREFDPNPTIKISKEDADAMNIKSGDLIKISNTRGHCLARAIVSVGMRKGVVNVPRGWHMQQFKDIFGADGGGSQLLTSRVVHPVTVTQSFYDAVVKIEKV